MSIRRAQDERIEGTPDGLNAVIEIADVPDAPSASAANVGTSRAYDNGAATVTLTNNATGGTPTSYTVTSSPGSFTGTGTSPVTVTGLASATSYTFTAVAINSTGTSPAGAASSSITATTVPQAPTIGTATVSGTTATVPYTAGATGGAAVSTFTATSSPGSITGTGASPITVSGLTGGTAYTFTVTATNANGTSTASSASNSVTAAFPAVAGYVGGGITSLGGSVGSTAVRKVQYSNDSVSTISATISGRESAAGVSNSGLAGYFAGGHNTTNIDKIVYATDSVSTLSAKVNFQARMGGFANSGTAGYFSNYYGNFSRINKLTFSNDTNSNLAWSGITPSAGTGDLGNNAWTFANSGTAGYSAAPGGTSTIAKMLFSNDTWSTLSTKITGTGINSGGNSMANSGTAGYSTGGSDGNASVSNIHKLTFSNDTNTLLGNKLTGIRALSSGFANKGVAGYIALGMSSTGGYNFTALGSVEKIAFSNDSASAFTLGTLSGYVPYSVGNEGSI